MHATRRSALLALSCPCAWPALRAYSARSLSPALALVGLARRSPMSKRESSRPGRGRMGRMRMWELQRFAAGGVVRTIGTGVYHDELCKGVEVGVSRDAVLAAILERGARASE